jgi:hypothetical protein
MGGEFAGGLLGGLARGVAVGRANQFQQQEFEQRSALLKEQTAKLKRRNAFLDDLKASENPEEQALFVSLMSEARQPTELQQIKAETARKQQEFLANIIEALSQAKQPPQAAPIQSVLPPQLPDPAGVTPEPEPQAGTPTPTPVAPAAFPGGPPVPAPPQAPARVPRGAAELAAARDVGLDEFQQRLEENARINRLLKQPGVAIGLEQAGVPVRSLLRRGPELGMLTGVRRPGFTGSFQVPFVRDTQTGEMRLDWPNAIQESERPVLKEVQIGPRGPTRLVPVDINTGEAIGLGLQTKPAEQLSTEELSKLDVPLPFGTTAEQAVGAGAKVLTTEERQQKFTLENVEVVLEKLDSMINETFVDGGMIEQIKTGAKQGFGFADFMKREDYAQYESLKEGLLASIYKAFGDKGQLSDGDLKRAKKLLPKGFPIPDTRERAQGKMANIRDLVADLGGRAPFSVPAKDRVPLRIIPAPPGTEQRLRANANIWMRDPETGREYRWNPVRNGVETRIVEL